jgi:hypothetical protein
MRRTRAARSASPVVLAKPLTDVARALVADLARGHEDLGAQAAAPHEAGVGMAEGSIRERVQSVEVDAGRIESRTPGEQLAALGVRLEARQRAAKRADVEQQRGAQCQLGVAGFLAQPAQRRETAGHSRREGKLVAGDGALRGSSGTGRGDRGRGVHVCATSRARPA